ncbi:MAG: 3-oxoacyl-ACP reductase family protein [Blastocatellia bacterium]|nr:3-oxoacyl-ACP reductase family protein [Blastocatellia bacterium]
MTMNKRERVALVTGAGRGIGRAIARGLAAAGFTICVNDIDPASAEACADELISAGGRARAAAADVSQPAQVTELFARAVGGAGRLDVLINNAGVSRPRPLVETSDADWSALLAVNLSSVFYCCRAAFPLMREAGGRIINLSSVSAHTGKVVSDNAAYVAAKAGVDGLTRALAREGAPWGIAVNSVAPGVVETEIHAQLSQERRAQLPGLIPTGRLASPEEIAEVVCFLAASAGSQLTGQVIHVNGGMYFA